MASLYWVGGSATWDATAGTKWATSSGGAGGAAVPTSGDDVFLDANSGVATIVLSGSSVGRSLNCTGFTGTLSHPTSVNVSIGDATAGASNVALKFVSGMTYTIANNNSSTITFVSTSATVQTVDFAGKTTGSIVYNANSNGSWQMTGSHVQNTTYSGANVTLTKGTLDVNGQTCTWGYFQSTSGSVRSLILGTANITIGGGAFDNKMWNVTSTGMTLSASSSTINFNTNYSASAYTITTAGLQMGTVTFANSNGNTLINDAMNCVNLTCTGPAIKSYLLSFIATITCSGTFTVTSNSILNRVLVRSNTFGTAVTVSAGATAITSADFADITGAGSATWDLSGSTGGAGDTGGNSNITFTTAATQTWSGTSGGNWSANAWTRRVPLPQDNVIINTAFSASQTVTVDMPRIGKTIDWTGATGTPRWGFTVSGCTAFGSVTLASGMTTSGTSGITFSGRGTYTLKCSGASYPAGVTIAAPNGTYTLQDDFSSNVVNNSNFVLSNGTFNANNFNVTLNKVSITGTTTRALTMGSGTWTIIGVDSGVKVWDATTTTGLTFSGANATIQLTNVSATVRTFIGGGLTYGTLTYTVSGSAGQLIISGANTFAAINFSDASAARTLTLPASTTTTVGIFNVVGTAANPLPLNSSTGGTTATVTKPNGIVNCDYLSLQDITVTGGARWCAGLNSTNGTNNSGWIFTSAPILYSGFMQN